MKIINAPSLANCPLLEIGEQTKQLAKGKADWFHIDIMDGHYVPNLCFPVRIIGELKKLYPHIAVDVHLMVEDPFTYINRLAEQKADCISFHMDATRFTRRLLLNIKSLNIKAGVVINPSQRVDIIESVIDLLDYVVLMSVEPGYAGQRFMPEAIPRLEELTGLRKKSGNNFLISIDGGIDYESAVKCAGLGAEVYITGVFTVFNQPEGIEEACLNFKQRVIEGVKKNTEVF